MVDEPRQLWTPLFCSLISFYVTLKVGNSGSEWIKVATKGRFVATMSHEGDASAPAGAQKSLRRWQLVRNLWLHHHPAQPLRSEKHQLLTGVPIFGETLGNCNCNCTLRTNRGKKSADPSASCSQARATFPGKQDGWDPVLICPGNRTGWTSCASVFVLLCSRKRLTCSNEIVIYPEGRTGCDFLPILICPRYRTGWTTWYFLPAGCAQFPICRETGRVGRTVIFCPS